MLDAGGGVEERGSLARVYLTWAGRETGAGTGGGLGQVVRGFARDLLSLKARGVLGPRDIVAVMGVRSDKFLVFMRAGDSADPGSLEARVKRLRERVEEALAGVVPEALRVHLTFHEGYSLMSRDPMLRAERSIHRALDEAMFMSLRTARRRTGARGLDQMIAAEGGPL